MDDPLIGLLTDFGEQDYFVASLKAVIAGINPRARTVDITHCVPSYDREAAAFILLSCYRFFPKGTIFLVVVDPGVATNRKIIYAQTRRYEFIAPDNGVLTPVLDRENIDEIRNVSSVRSFLSSERTTFEARDRMAPAAAWLSLGVSPRELGRKLTRFQRMEAPGARRSRTGVDGCILYIDKFGNLITNIPGGFLQEMRQECEQGKDVVLTVGDREIRRFQTSYQNRKHKEIFALINSVGLVEVAVGEASAAELTGAERGTSVRIAWKKTT